MPKIDCISCGVEFESSQLGADGVCEPCNLEDCCSNCNQYDLDCTCDNDAPTDKNAFVYGFDDEDFGDEDNSHDELNDWEGDGFTDEANGLGNTE